MSVATPPNATIDQTRKGLEAALITAYRRDRGESRTANFARIIPGYAQSSYRRDGERGGPLSAGGTKSHTKSGSAPLAWTDWQQPTTATWMGLPWSELTDLATIDAPVPTSDSVYRLWVSSPPPLTYIGQSSNLQSRLYRHRGKRDGPLQVSYAILPDRDARHTREEAEVELIGALASDQREPT